MVKGETKTRDCPYRKKHIAHTKYQCLHKISNNQEQEIFFHSPAYFKASSYNRPRPHRNQSSHCPAGPGKRKAKAPGNGKAKVAEAKGKRAQAARPHDIPRGTPRPLFPWQARAFRTVHGRHRPLRDAPVAVAVAGAPGPRAARRVSTPQPRLVRGPSGQCPQPRERIMAFS